MNQSQQSLSECKQWITDLSNTNIDKESYEKLQNTIQEFEQYMETERQLFLSAKSEISEKEQEKQQMEIKLEQKQHELNKLKERNEICEYRLKACQEQILKLQQQLKEKSELEDKAKEVQQKYQQQLIKLKDNFDRQQKCYNHTWLIQMKLEISLKKNKKNILLKEEFESEKRDCKKKIEEIEVQIMKQNWINKFELYHTNKTVQIDLQITSLNLQIEQSLDSSISCLYFNNLQKQI